MVWPRDRGRLRRARRAEMHRDDVHRVPPP